MYTITWHCNIAVAKSFSSIDIVDRVRPGNKVAVKQVHGTIVHSTSTDVTCDVTPKYFARTLSKPELITVTPAIITVGDYLI